MSTYYHERMEADLREIHTEVHRASDLVENQVERAVEALLTQDSRLAADVVLGDRQVNRKIKRIDALCHSFVVRHAPTEEYLRRASAVLRLDVALERVGDYASSICREVGRLSGPPPKSVEPGLRGIAEKARLSLADALRAFHEGDEELARSSVSIPDTLVLEVFHGLLSAGDREELPLVDMFGYLHVLNLLMRVAEQSENICEQTLFALLGETPPPKAFRVLFVDAGNDGVSQLAEAYARAKYPASGSYESGGWKPAAEVDAELVRFAGTKGLDLSGARPKPFQADEFDDHPYHVIVFMEPDGLEHVVPLHFRTTVVTWDVTAEPDLDSLFEAVEARVDELMTTLAGPEAA